MIHVRQIKKRPIPLFVEQSQFEQFTPTRRYHHINESNELSKYYRSKNMTMLKNTFSQHSTMRNLTYQYGKVHYSDFRLIKLKNGTFINNNRARSFLTKVLLIIILFMYKNTINATDYCKYFLSLRAKDRLLFSFYKIVKNF